MKPIRSLQLPFASTLSQTHFQHCVQTKCYSLLSLTYLQRLATLSTKSEVDHNQQIMSNSQIPLNLLTVTEMEIQRLYSDSALTAVSLVQSILTLIEKHNEAGLGLRALLSVVPHADILERARRLDEELSQGKSHGPLHGIHFTVKVRTPVVLCGA
jgi:hypothetical protein